MYYLNAVQETSGGILGVFSGFTKTVAGLWSSLVKNITILIFIVLGLLIFAGILYLLKLKKKSKNKSSKILGAVKKGASAKPTAAAKTIQPASQAQVIPQDGATGETKAGAPIAVEFDKS